MSCSVVHQRQSLCNSHLSSVVHVDVLFSAKVILNLRKTPSNSSAGGGSPTSF